MRPAQQSHSAALGPGVTGPSLAVASAREAQAAGPGPQAQVPTCGAAPFAVDPACLAAPRQRTQYPYVTGTSVLGMIYGDGVMIACDTLGAYGSTKRYKSLERIFKVNDRCMVAASGEVSDFQQIQRYLDELVMGDFQAEDGIELGPREVYNYLCRIMYNRRNKMDPLWNSLIVGGVENGEPFLGTVGMIGTHYTDDHVTTGFANMLARPLFREKQSNDMSEQAATELMHEALKVCYYRDKNSINKFQLAKVTSAGVTISEPFALDMKWDHKHFADPTKWALGSW